jgi:hypothetical protein
MFTKTRFKELDIGSLFVTNDVEPGCPSIFGNAVLWVRHDRNSGTCIAPGRYGACHFDFEDEVYQVDGEQAESTILLQFTPE